MSQAPVKLEATARPRAGKGAARQARREGHVPAVIYGAKKPPVSISVDHNTLAKQIAKGHFTSTVFEITVGWDEGRVDEGAEPFTYRVRLPGEPNNGP